MHACLQNWQGAVLLMMSHQLAYMLLLLLLQAHSLNLSLRPQ
jgi:hypothetical protein